MAGISTFPTPFLPCPGEPAIPFDTWLRMFKNYLLIVGASGDAWPVERKRALLPHCLGTEGHRLFYTLPNQGNSMEDAIATLKAHFAPRRNIVAERHAFRKRVQAPEETILQYVAALRDLAATCDFEDTLDDMLRDQKNKKIKNSFPFSISSSFSLSFSPSLASLSLFEQCLRLGVRGISSVCFSSSRLIALCIPPL